MDKGLEKLGKDLSLISAMAAEMEAYLASDILFWNMSGAGTPALTLGGYLFRAYRLHALRPLLDAAQQEELDRTSRKFNLVLSNQVVRFEQKSHRELDARIRQWGEYLNDLDRGVASKTTNYNTAVETRAMLAAFEDKLSVAPYELQPRIGRQIELLDGRLRGYWQAGDFVWPESWTPAYPPDIFWWLYGAPRERRSA